MRSLSRRARFCRTARAIGDRLGEVVFDAGVRPHGCVDRHVSLADAEVIGAGTRCYRVRMLKRAESYLAPLGHGEVDKHVTVPGREQVRN